MYITKTEVYLDNAATTRCSEKAAKKIYQMLTQNFGNPSSLHTKGLNAQKEMDTARTLVAKKLGVADSEITFTSGGTEANNLAVLGAARCRKRMGKRVVTSQIEHSSVLEAFKQLEEEGFEVIYLQPNSSGLISKDDIEQAINEETVLVSLMYVNNETGMIQPVEAVQRIIKRKNAPAVFHCDAVQAFGKIPFTASKIKADLITVTAHKINGPKGVGALYIKKGVRTLPLVFGGSQEKKLRPGTQAVSLICGFGAACEEIDYTGLKVVEQTNSYLREKLSEIEIIKINSADTALPYIINFSVVGIRSETMLHFLADENIFVSSGSACAKGKASHVLSAMGLNGKELDGTVRVSFSKFNNKNDIDRLITAIKKAVNTLARA